MFLAGAILFVVGNWIIMPIVTYGSAVQVPDLRGMDVAEAKQVLRDGDLVFLNDTSDYVWSEDIPANRIVRQDPPPYTTVMAGRSVRVVISRGAQFQEVPSVVSLSPVQAKLILVQQGFTVGRIRYSLRAQDDHSDPYVLAQDPQPGVVRASRSPVDLVVSVVPDMPDVRGRTLDEARGIIEPLGLRIGLVTYQVDLDLLPGSVIDQSIGPGQHIHEGEQVDVVVSQQPAQPPEQ